jgi:hypothetical protein
MMTADITASVPVAGYYGVRLVRGGYEVPVRLWFGAPVLDGEEQDRAPRWCVEVAGKTTKQDDDGLPEYLDPFDYWPWCARSPISAAEYGHRLRLMAWAAEHAPNHPAANPYQPIDVRNLAPVTP